MKPIKMLALSACVGAVVVAGCGGGDSTSAPDTASGIFTDSAVGGLRYTSGGQSASTGADGSFTCEVGQPVTFTLGNLVLPTVTCAAGTNVVSPMTLFGTSDLTDPRVVNLAQLLQTLDSSGDPTDGITIDGGVYTALTDISGVDFDDANFDVNTVLGEFIDEVKGVPTDLVSESDATAHLQGQTLAGTWSYAESDGVNFIALTFFADGTYMTAESGVADPVGGTGMERGTYTWNPATGALTASALVDTNGEWGISHIGDAAAAQIAGNAMTIDLDDNGSFPFVRLVPEADPIVGSWYSDDDHHVTFTFFADGSYMEAQDGTTDLEHGHSGMERGTYTWNQETGVFSASTLVDTDGEWGVSHPQGAITIQIVGNTLTFTIVNEGTSTFTRIVP